MPPTYSIFNTTTTTNIILVDGNFNMVRGNFRHLDRSTTITNTDPFNVQESTGQSFLPTTSLAPNSPVPPNPSAERPDHDTDRPSSISEAPYQPVNVAVLAQLESTVPVEISTSLNDERSSPLHQSSTEASEPQLSLSPPRQSQSKLSDERTKIRRRSLIKTNRFKSVHKKIKDWLKQAFDYFRVHHG